MKKQSDVALQELAEFLQDAAYSDEQGHRLRWHLSIVHPRNSDGTVHFSGGIWNKREVDDRVAPYLCITFDYNEIQGILNVRTYMGTRKIFSTKQMSFEDFKKETKQLFQIKKLYRR